MYLIKHENYDIEHAKNMICEHFKKKKQYLKKQHYLNKMTLLKNITFKKKLTP